LLKEPTVVTSYTQNVTYKYKVGLETPNTLNSFKFSIYYE